MARKPAVAGRFYPAEEQQVRSMIEQFTAPQQDKRKVLGALSPHAGYVFCGGVMGKVFGGIEVPKTVLLLNPSHNYYEPAFALWRGGAWITPLGEAPLHEQLCEGLSALPMVTDADGPHKPEHSGEVVLPFLQYHQPDLRIAVVCIASAAGLAELLEFGASAADVLRDCGEDNALVVASSDMSHESGTGAVDVVNRNDPLAIERMEKLNPEGLFKTCRSKRITMCGVLPAAAMMASVKARGGTRGVLVGRATSADSPYGSGDYVVGYAGMVFD